MSENVVELHDGQPALILSLRQRVADLEKALNLCMAGGNHLANYLIGAVGAGFVDDYPSGSKHEDISAAFGPQNNRDYEVWCCWDAIMRARNEVTEHHTSEAAQEAQEADKPEKAV